METADLSHHILSRFNADLEGVRSSVLQMGGLVEQQLQDGVRAVVQGDSRLGEEVAALDHKVNAMEIAIDDDCSRILATRSPAASDLRLIVAVIKTITDLERIGDEAEKLGHIGCAARQHRASDRSLSRSQAHRRARRRHGATARSMRSRGSIRKRRCRWRGAIDMVDEEYDAIQRQCITFMMEDPRTIRRALDVLWVARALERVGDHAKNICEYVIYMVLGKDVRHLSLDDVEQHLASARAAARGRRPVDCRLSAPLRDRRHAQPARASASAPRSWRMRSIAQHVLGYEPCPLCILQRVAVIALGVLFLLAWVHDSGPDRRARLRRSARSGGARRCTASPGGTCGSSRSRRARSRSAARVSTTCSMYCRYTRSWRRC